MNQTINAKITARKEFFMNFLTEQGRVFNQTPENTSWTDIFLGEMFDNSLYDLWVKSCASLNKKVNYSSTETSSINKLPNYVAAKKLLNQVISLKDCPDKVFKNNEGNMGVLVEKVGENYFYQVFIKNENSTDLEQDIASMDRNEHGTYISLFKYVSEFPSEFSELWNAMPVRSTINTAA